MMKLADNPVFIAMVVRDAEKTLNFYQGVLGMESGWTEPMDEGGMKYYLRFQGGILKIFAPDKEPQKVPKDVLGNTGYRILTFIVTNIDELAEHLKKQGVRIVVPLQSSGESKYMLIFDPEGNCIEFAQRG